MSISGLILLFAVLPFLSLTTAAALPSNCTQSGISVSCTYYADSALSSSSQCNNGLGSFYAMLDVSIPGPGITANPGFCGAYSGPELLITSVTTNVYVNPYSTGAESASLLAGESVLALSPPGHTVASGHVGTLDGISSSCSQAFTDVSLALNNASIVLNPGVTLFFGLGGESNTCTGAAVGGQDTPTSVTITGTEVGTTTVTTTATQTQTSTSSVTSTVTATAISTVLTNTTVTTGACITATATPYGVPEVPQDPTTVTSTVNATTTTTTTTTLTATVTTTLPVTETTTLTTCTTSSPTTVPQFPVAGLGALALVALLLPVLALLIRLRRNSIPSTAA